jgi:hypothetical protein
MQQVVLDACCRWMKFTCMHGARIVDAALSAPVRGWSGAVAVLIIGVCIGGVH